MYATKMHLFEGASATELQPIFADVEAYPDFVPGFKSAKIFRKHEQEYRTKIKMALEVGFLTFEEDLVSITRETFPTHIDVRSRGSRFIRTFDNAWRFRDQARDCHVSFEMTLELMALPSVLLPMMTRLVQTQADKLLQAFVARVESKRIHANWSRQAAVTQSTKLRSNPER